MRVRDRQTDRGGGGVVAMRVRDTDTDRQTDRQTERKGRGKGGSNESE